MFSFWSSFPTFVQLAGENSSRNTNDTIKTYIYIYICLVKKRQNEEEPQLPLGLQVPNNDLPERDQLQYRHGRVWEGSAVAGGSGALPAYGHYGGALGVLFPKKAS